MKLYKVGEQESFIESQAEREFCLELAKRVLPEQILMETAAEIEG